jgi:endonuclease/exonuclease/phosphatase family metal-dependent hydrolase
MPRTYSWFTERVFLFLNILVAVVFLLASLIPFLNPKDWWFISLLGFGFAPLFFALVLCTLLWLIFKPRYVFVSLVPLLIGWQSVVVLLAVNTPGQFNYQKPKGAIRVASWNVARFTEWKRNNNKGSQTRLKMLDLLKEQNADVLCLQEFFHSTDTAYYDNLSKVMNDLGYSYYHFAWDHKGREQYYGQAIFSRYPIIDSGLVRYPRPGQTESLLYADIKVNTDTVRFYTTHLQSVHFRKDDFRDVEEIKSRDDSLIENSRNIFAKLKRGIIFRARQAGIVRELLGDAPYPYIFTGDFNDVPNSYAYFTIRQNLQDAFLEKGFGIGRTYTSLSPTLRIDYILATKDFRVQQFNRLVKDYSDHYLLVADLQLEKRN